MGVARKIEFTSQYIQFEYTHSTSDEGVKEQLKSLVKTFNMLAGPFVTAKLLTKKTTRIEE